MSGKNCLVIGTAAPAVKLGIAYNRSAIVPLGAYDKPLPQAFKHFRVVGAVGTVAYENADGEQGQVTALTLGQYHYAYAVKIITAGVDMFGNPIETTATEIEIYTGM